ncbi:MAG: ornithine carbamoyltransferase [Candidatus Marinamargulisbacteria bacterium]
MHFLNISDISATDIQSILRLANKIKKNVEKPLLGQSIGLIFEKPSNRTRLSFEVGIHRLGGHAVYIKGDEIQLGVREPVSHVSRVLSRYFDLIVYRTTSHANLVELSNHSTIPVINGLSDVSHPCQAVADALTIQDHFGSFNDVFLTYIGDGNNVCQSLMHIAVKCGFQMAVVGPKKYHPVSAPDGIIITDTIEDVIQKTNVIYTDVWVSMGDEADAEQRAHDFMPYQVTSSILELATPATIFLHCLPANIGKEVTNDVFESPKSKVFDQAENRMHAQNAIMHWLMKGQ